MIHVIATVDVIPGKREDFLAEFRKVIPKVHTENGCLEYGPTIDLPVAIPRQLPYREHVVVIMEKWTGIDALNAHLTAPHMAAYREAVKDMVSGMTIQILEPA